MNKIKLNIKPIAKPRMTQSDKWAKRDVVKRYFAFKDELIKQADAKGFELQQSYSILFCLPFPKSYSKKKCESLLLQAHKLKPDLDNLLKAINDSFLQDDSAIYCIRAKKIWAYEGSITIINHC